jgi:uncharacterized membrane protein
VPQGPVHWDRWFLAIGVPYSTLLLLLLPPSNAADEARHLARIDQIARGHLVAPLDARQQATGHVDGCLSSFLTRLDYDMSNKRWRPADAFHRPSCGRSQRIELSNVALNSPVPYVPGLVGYVVGRLLGGVLLGFWLARIAGLLAYLGLCWLAIRIAPVGKPFLMFVALLPTAVLLATTVSADPLAISLGLLAAAVVLRLRVPRNTESETDPTRRLLALLAVCLLLLALSKNLYAVMGLLVLLVPAERFSSRGRRQAYVAGVIASTAGVAAAWGILVVNRIRVVLPFLLDDSFVQRSWIRAHPLGFLKIGTRSVFGTTLLPTHTWPTLVASLVGARPTRAFAAPPVVSLVALGLAIVGLAMTRMASGDGAAARTTFDRVAVYAIPAVVFLTVLALVVYGEAITFTAPLATGVNVTFVEGRFFVPVLGVLLVPLARSGTVAVRSGPAWAGWTMLLGSAGLAIWSLAWLVDLQY